MASQANIFFLSADFKEFSSSAEIATLRKLAKLDLKKGTTIAELVFKCCQWFPKKEAIESLVELGKLFENEKKVIESLFQFQNPTAINCLLIIFDMANKYRNENDEYPSGPKLHDIEKSCLYLIELAKSSNLDLKKILNQANKAGSTLFFYASIHSEEITKRLLLEPVRVNSISDKFVTPFFRVRYKVYFLKVTSLLVR